MTNYKKTKSSLVDQFFKPTQWDDDEWGNIELPGLSDEELHGKNWNRVTAAKEINSRQYVKQAILENCKKLEAEGHYKRVAKKNQKNPKWLEKVRANAEQKRGVRRLDLERPWIAEGKKYDSMALAAKAYGISKTAMSDKRTRNPDAFYWEDEGPTPVKLWYYITPQGRFSNVKEMQKATGKTGEQIRTSTLANVKGYDYRLETRDNWLEKNGGSIWQQGKTRKAND